MKWIVLALLILALHISVANAQNDITPKLVVVGNASSLVVPDQIQLRFSFDLKDKSQKAVAQRLTDATDKLLNLLSNFSIDEADLQIIGLKYGEEYDYTAENPKRIGFNASKIYQVDLRYTQAGFAALIDSLFANNIKDMRFTYKMQMSPQLTEATEKDLIKRSVADAQKSARIIADATGMALDAIFRIDYGELLNREGVGYQPAIQKSVNSNQASEQANLAISETIVRKSIIITWILKKK